MAQPCVQEKGHKIQLSSQFTFFFLNLILTVPLWESVPHLLLRMEAADWVYIPLWVCRENLHLHLFSICGCPWPPSWSVWQIMSHCSPCFQCFPCHHFSWWRRYSTGEGRDKRRMLINPHGPASVNIQKWNEQTYEGQCNCLYLINAVESVGIQRRHLLANDLPMLIFA